MLSATTIVMVLLGYFILLMLVSRVMSHGLANSTFFTAGRNSPWFLVSFGMIGASLSGVTFVSVPGEVGNSGMTYFQVVIGYFFGYLIIAKVLLPVYYRLELVTIYQFLNGRFGIISHRCGAAFFLLSRVVGASFRMFLVASVLQFGFFDQFGIPFWVTVTVSVALIWVYTFKGGIQTIVLTDTVQTASMLLSLVVCFGIVVSTSNMSSMELLTMITKSGYLETWRWHFHEQNNFWMQFLSGVFIAVVMTGLDQDMMQKNLTCRSLHDAQKNVFWLSISLIFINLVFLLFGVVIYEFAENKGVALPSRSDLVFPYLALNYFGTFGAITFLVGIVAAAYSSADSALTSLTTSFSVDFLGMGTSENNHEAKTRNIVHIGFSVILILVTVLFDAINDRSVVTSLFKAAGYTYGPLLGLFSLGIFTRWQIKDRYVPLICVASPLISYFIDKYSSHMFGGYQIGFEILIFNAAITFFGLMFIRKHD